jgi:isoleucyl-tRNA synthetase
MSEELKKDPILSDVAQKTDSTLSPVAAREEEILAFWRENQIFEKTLEQTRGGKEYVFYDGPPFATGTPHYGHIVAGTMKDALPRYQTMQGCSVRRRWGWDCHGLPIENLIEKDLGLKSKKDIEDYGIGNFNRKARERVQQYVGDWRQIVPRLGRFIDMENDYRTMDWYYTESVMNIFKTLHDKGLIYEGYKSMQICPRCETTLSNFEVNQGYKDITDISVTVKFELVSGPGTFVLAWTTTPWTLPGNVALAVNPEIDYVKVKQAENIYIVAKPRLEKYFSENFEIVGEMKGSELIGKAYKPAFDYYVNDPEIKNKENGWKIYGADFVTTEDGTGVVHIAPAFGEDDMKLGQKEKLPFIQHVAMNGHFKKEVKDWADVSVKPKGDAQSTDIEVLKNLAGKGILFSKEKIVHSYPHCWRCETPLLNYATSSWFVEVTRLKDNLVANNKTVGWVPEHVKEGRFGKWLEGARDWAISRTRFWGAPIPVWRCEECKKIEVVGSVKEMSDKLPKSSNKFTVIRHGQATNNVNNICSCLVDNPDHLTDLGKEQVKATAERLKGEKFDYIFASSFIRTKETAEILAENFGMDKASIIYDQRLWEENMGDRNGTSSLAYDKEFVSSLDRFNSRPGHGGETYQELKNRASELVFELDAKYQNKNILIVTHSGTAWLLYSGALGLNPRESLKLIAGKSLFLQNGEDLKFEVINTPHNENYELDLHRPYIDDVIFACDCGGKMKRVPDVFDCWFESGSMPYAQAHYPFENKDVFDPEKGIGFPADFIAEGMDQTRGWFYSMLVLSTALFDKSSFKNVIVNGLVLAEDGQKMSKSLKNYPDPMELVSKFGSDALRFYLLSSPVMRAEDLNFSEKGVGEVYRKIIMRLNNVYSFYEMYACPRGDETSTRSEAFSIGAPKDAVAAGTSENVLDLWINARFGELVTKVTDAMNKHELDRSVRPIDEFIDDLSNWYLRRSRDRFKSDDIQDKNWAISTTRSVLNGLAKIMAPFTPFVAEDIYRKTGSEKLSVHLESWPVVETFDSKIIEEMSKARELVEIGLALRDRKSLKVRQPVGQYLVSKDFGVSEKMLGIIADEINSKEVKISDLSGLSAEKYEIYTNEATNQIVSALDYEITPELRAEGGARELMRNIQELRKKSGLNPGDMIKLKVTSDSSGQNLVNKFIEEIKKGTGTTEIIFTEGQGETKIDGMTFGIEIQQ